MSERLAITVRLFAQAREAAGAAEKVLSVSPGSTVEEALAALARDVPAVAPHLRRCSFAVNGSYEGRDHRLQPGDELAVIPPIGGG